MLERRGRLLKVTTFRIRRRIIQAFLFCVLAILVFAGLSFQAHWEMEKRLRLVERADDLVNNILEIRRFEKNFFLYRQSDSLREARSGPLVTLFLAVRFQARDSLTLGPAAGR
jgi:hypothetical protein